MCIIEGFKHPVQLKVDKVCDLAHIIPLNVMLLVKQQIYQTY